MFRVLKFGGSSVAGATNISRVMDILGAEAPEGQLVVVCSAISGCTDTLLEIASGKTELIPALKQRHLDIVCRLFTGEERREAEILTESLFSRMEAAPDEEKVTWGEIFSTRIIAAKLRTEGWNARWLDSRNLIVVGEREETYRRIREALDAPADLFIVPGFIASDASGKVTTLGRGGSDFSAALYAAACGADSLEIWTDVPGFMTANPKDVATARTIPQMSYKAAEALAWHGAKVLYAPTVAPAMEKGIPIRILNTFDPENPGTVISGAHSSNSGGWIGVTSRKAGDETNIYLVGNGEENGMDRVGACLRREGIAPLEVVPDGENVSLKVRTVIASHALEALHREFFEQAPSRTLDLFIAGYGSVGKALVRMIGSTAATVAQRAGKVLRIAGVGNSRKAVFDPAGIDPERVEALMAEAPESNFVEEVLAVAVPGSIFVDCTDSESIYQSYVSLMERRLNVVSSNRRSLSVPFVEYAAMHAAAQRNGVFFRYETTVGAALPVLESISRGANTCDEVLSIEAVVSCTLNQILGGYTGGGVRFTDLLRQAQQVGLTEADPRTDLDGRDALRKLLILSREAGVPLEEADVTVQSLVPPGTEDVPLEEFYAVLEVSEPSFARRFAPREGLRPRFVASLQRDYTAPLGYKASIEVRMVDSAHPAYYLRGTENAIIVRSSFHPYPLVIQGAGEGAKQASSSILNDILR